MVARLDDRLHRLSGGQLPGDRKFDGRDPLPTLTSGKPSPHESLYFGFRTHAALRMGEWKIVREKPSEPWQLFNLREDLAESNNLAARHPERLSAMIESFNGWLTN